MSVARGLQSGRATMLWFQSALTPEGWARDVRIVVADGRIARLEQGVAPQPGDERHGVVIPGLCNLHSHAFQRGMAGLAETRGPEGDNFWTWREVMYRFLDRLGPEQVEAITAQAYVEMLERGFTRVGEFHYLHHTPSGAPYANLAELAERVVAAAGETGIGMTLLPVFYAHGNFGGEPPSPGQRRFLNSTDQFARLVEAARGAIAPLHGVNLGIAPHSLRAVTPDELDSVVQLAGDGPIHIHVAEQTKEVDDCLAWSGARPVQWLLDHAAINSNWCFVHATHLTNSETTRLAHSGAVAGLCPITEANLGDGVFPAVDFLGAGGVFGLGTDSNVLIDAAGELRALEYAQRLFLRSRNVLAPEAGRSTGRALFEGALAGGAQALGLERTGLREGASADFVSFDLGHPAILGKQHDNLLDSWIFAGGALDCVWQRGRKLVSGGRHVRRDPIRQRFRRAIDGLLQ
jgi:formimidoylglutamate deiminase